MRVVECRHCGETPATIRVPANEHGVSIVQCQNIKCTEYIHNHDRNPERWNALNRDWLRP